MQTLIRFAVARPRAALATWLTIVAALALLGLGVGRHLQPASVRVEGSSSARAAALVAGHFDDSSSLPVLLTGPSRDVRAQGRRLAARLGGERGVTVLSPWSDPAHRALLRPSPRELLLVVSVRGTEHGVQAAAVHVRDVADASVHRPVSVAVTGVPLVARDLRGASLAASRRADLLALPILLLVLLLVFRSVAAAAVPVAFGAATILASGGVVRLLTALWPVDAFSTGLASMMGLALAVDYSLLALSRYRDERADGRAPAEAVVVATAASGRTVAVAGLAVVVAMVLAAMLAAGPAVASAALGVAAAAVLAMLGAALALPAVLALAGDRLGLPPRRAAGGWTRLGAIVLLRPALVAAVSGGALLALGLPALAIRPSAPDAAQLPAASPARAGYAAISRAAGPGWGGQFEVVAVAPSGTMATPARLAALARLERSLGRDPDVRAVLGPGALASRAARLRRAGRALLKAQRALGAGTAAQRAHLDRLGSSVDRAAGGASSVEGSLQAAVGAAARLGAGGRAATGGAGRLASGLTAATDGARRLSAGISEAAGARRLLGGGLASARATASSLAGDLGTLGRGESQVGPAVGGLEERTRGRHDDVTAAASAVRAQRSDALTAIAQARAALATAQRSTATVAASLALAHAQTVLRDDSGAARLDTVAAGLQDDAATAARLAGALRGVGIHPLAAQARALVQAIAAAQGHLGSVDARVTRLASATRSLLGTLERLGGGAGALAGGLRRLEHGLGDLQASARTGRDRTAALAAGLDGARGAVAGIRSAPTTAGRPAAGTSGAGGGTSAIDSGYFLLAALDGSGRGAPGLDVARGGQAARIVVVPRTGPNDPRTRALGRRLQAAADRRAAQTGARTAVGGPAQVLADYESATAARLPIIVVALALATALLLAVLLRSAVVALLGVALNLLAVGATLGALDRLFTGGHPLLGGPGRLDATALTTIFAVMFALSTDYQVFVVTRVREELARGGDVRRAIAAGVGRTARVVTGAALSMVTVFVVFGGADVASLRQFGVGLALAVALDATLVRLVLLPALLALAGRRAWWPLRVPRSAARRPRGEPAPAPAQG